jgi:hypothetical protein
MKWFSKIFLFCALLFIIQSKAQLDTLNYLKHKANYIEQPFSKLLNDISQVHPKTVWAVPNFKTKNYNFSTNFNFCDKEFSFYNVITLSVEWENPILRSETKYYQRLNDSFFTNDGKGFYGSKIIKDIKVYR